VNRIRGLTLAQRMYASSGALIALLVAVAGLVWVLLTEEATKAQVVVDKRIPQLERIAEIEINVTRASLMLRHGILARDPAELKAAADTIQGYKATLESTVAEFGRQMHTAEGQRAFEPMPALLAQFWQIAGQNLALVQQGQKDEAFAFLIEKTIPARNALLGPLNVERKRQGERVTAEVMDMRDSGLSARNWVLGAVLLVSAGLLWFCVSVLRVMRSLGAEPNQLRHVADAVAGGDLSVPIHLQACDTRSVMASLARMQQQLSNTVSSVRMNAELVATASVQIASGNLDLSRRTEQQASGLQQTASSMEELGATVQSNADSSRQANQLAAGASSVAVSGGALVQQVVSTMKDIDDSSRRIAEIIGVIDSIAFQTNILALNAAVEAARAGEQGRGFAVVASEVRNLAQRSAAAAREIKGLIDTSVERVHKGTALVDDAGRTMQEIVASIQRVSDIVGEISSASGEQAQGVALVGQAVTDMDKTTQQNAALVEESAAAAETLRQQAQQLVQAVAVFRLA
jgi:methyl-accepting chemotaxis protein